MRDLLSDFPLAKIEGANAAPRAVAPMIFRNSERFMIFRFVSKSFCEYRKNKNMKQSILFLFSIHVYFVSFFILKMIF